LRGGLVCPCASHIVLAGVLFWRSRYTSIQPAPNQPNSFITMNTYSLDYIDDLYVRYVEDPQSVDEKWRKYFEEFSLASQRQSSGLTATATTNDESLWLARMQERVDQLVREYRVRGHLLARVDPLNLRRAGATDIDALSYGLTEEDLNRPFTAPTTEYTNGRTLGDILKKLRNTYCRSIGAQFTHIDDRHVRDWLQRRMESTENRLELTRATQLRLYQRLADAEIFESFVRKKFVGAKTFSLEGSESLIPLLDRALEKAGEHGVKSVVMGMAHRGRLNVLANIMGKRAQSIFWSFDDPKPDMFRGGGDVKYHMGYSSDWNTAAGQRIHLSLCFNPSHLEFVNPVVLGRCRGKQDRMNDVERDEVMSILIHGDAAFAGEGIVQETLNLSQLEGYKTGGTLHIVINNQIGFTTQPHEGRSSTYCTDVFKMLQSPIFHVNGEDPEAVAQVVALAMDFRHKFQRDVIIDLYAYRRLGHNENDEPRFTQPEMYQVIDAHKSVRHSYLMRLLQMGEITREEAEQIDGARNEKLSREFDAAKNEQFVSDQQSLAQHWSGYFGGPMPDVEQTVEPVREQTLRTVLTELTTTPAGFSIVPKLNQFMTQRREMAQGTRALDWAAAEALAFGTLLLEGHPIRLSGQDCQRGTFSQRHAVLHDVANHERFIPLANLSGAKANIEIINSPLSEAGVLGFDYGYSLDYPEGLIAWEAQFGDFWNTAQVIVDQFITSAEDKWKRLSKLIMLLPHGFEGQGPEHCSARLERFLLLTAEDNVVVAQPSTPAQYYHLLRRHTKSRWAKPLIVLTPKSLLRHKLCISNLADFENGKFDRVIPDQRIGPVETKRVILCTGKVYYDLVEERDRLQCKNVAIIRIEQFYPFRGAELVKALEPYASGTDLVWFQDEPTNMGGWYYVKVRLGDFITPRFPLRSISRPESASPSTGSSGAHKLEQRELLDQAFANL
jgi:2-oxoglutarate dehydrogenase E1 component